MTAPAPGSRQRLAGAALLALVFVAGLLAGAALDRSVVRGRFPGRRGHGPMPLDGLELTAAQCDSVSAIFERHRPAIRAIFESTGPRLDSALAALRADIRAQLTPEQQQAFDRIPAPRRHDRPGGPPGEARREPPPPLPPSCRTAR